VSKAIFLRLDTLRHS